MSKLHISIASDHTTEFCQRWLIKELAVFGSVLRDDFRPDCDMDVLFTFDTTADWGLLDHKAFS